MAPRGGWTGRYSGADDLDETDVGVSRADRGDQSPCLTKDPDDLVRTNGINSIDGTGTTCPEMTQRALI